MIRKQVYLEPRQNRQLARLARERGATQAEVIREAIDLLAAGATSRAAASIWARETEFMRAWIALGPLPQLRRDWKREDLYRERLDRHGADSG